MGEDDRDRGVSTREADRVGPESRNPAPGVEEHDRVVLGRQGHERVDRRMGEAEAVRARMELDPRRARIETPTRLEHAVVRVRVDPDEGGQPPRRS